MKKVFFSLIFFVLTYFSPHPVSAQAENEYAFTSFNSNITIEKDTTLKIVETIGVYYPYEKHGIYRYIPYIYTANGRTIRADIHLESVTDQDGKGYIYETQKENGNFAIKIGDPDRTIQGSYTYVITYTVSRILQEYEDHDELYWNVTGHDWDTIILSSEATVSSPHANITKVDCFAGEFGSTTKDCTASNTSNTAQFISTKTIGNTKDFSIIVGLSKDNELVFPSLIEKTGHFIYDNWAYPIVLLPFAFLAYTWFKRGRDQKYAGENVYYKPDNTKVVTKPLFYREHLPTVYSPIQGLSPSEIGTIVDQKVDINDIVAEITELARLGYLKIVRLEKDKLIGRDVDYIFLKLKDDTSKLTDYQEYLFEKLFESKFTSKAHDEIAKWSKKDPDAKQYAVEALANKAVLLSSLSKEFYVFLDSYRDKLYKHIEEKHIFDGRPDKVRQKWIGIFIVLNIVSGFIAMQFGQITNNYGPVILQAILALPSFFFAYAMPRRKAWGYSLYRQIEGLAFYLKKGKWREEIAEKNLFFAEMLPLAISLRIVDELAKDMEVLGIKPPAYFSGVHVNSFASDFSSFESNAASIIGTAPSGRSGGSWSGGSGFSGGSSGGGFGGGGGGSW